MSPSTVPSIAPASTRDRRLRRTVALAGSDGGRHDAARALARFLVDSGGDHAQVGFVSRRAPGVFYPRLTVDARADVPRRDGPGRPAVTELGGVDGFRWELRIHGGPSLVTDSWDALKETLSAWVRTLELRGRPEDATPAGWLLSVLDEFRVHGWALRRDDLLTVLRAHAGSRLGGLAAEPRQAAERVLDALPDRPGLAAALMELGEELERGSDFGAATAVFRLAYEAWALRGDVSGAAAAARGAGQALRKQAEFGPALAWLGLAGRLGELEGDWKAVSLARNGEAVVLSHRGAVPAAEARYLEALEAAERSGDPEALGRAHHGLMVVSRSRGRPDEALSHGSRAVECYPDVEDRGLVLVGMGTLFLERGDLEGADHAYALAGAWIGQHDGRFVARMARGYVAALRGDRAAHDAIVARVDEVLPSVSPRTRVMTRLYVGRGLRALGDPSADDYLEAALAEAEALGLAEFLFQAERELGAVPDRPDDAGDTAARVRAALGSMRAALAAA